MPVSKKILTRLENNDPSLVHLDLSFQYDLHFITRTNTWVADTNEQNRLTDEDLIELAEALTHNTHLKSLNLDKNKAGASGLAKLASKGLEKLSLSKNGLNSACIDALMLYDMLTSLDVSGNMLKDEDLAKLGQLTKLSSLDVSENKVGPLFMGTFGLNSTLKKLVVRDNKFELNGYRAPLCINALEHNRSLEWLDITSNVIETDSLKVLSTLPELQALNLEECYFFTNELHKKADVTSIIQPLTKIPKLTWLSIRKVDPRRRDMDLVAILLAPLPLEYLDVSGIQMSAVGAKALASSTTLTTLKAQENFIGPYGLLDIAKNRYISELDLSRNDMKYSISYKPEIDQKNRKLFGSYPANIMTEVMNAFEQNNILQKLNLSNQRIPYGNYISDSEFASLIKNNTNITSLDIRHYAYHVGPQVIHALAENNTLRDIRFSADLDNPAHKTALSNNIALTTIECYTRHQKSSFAQMLQERNRDAIQFHLFTMLVVTLGEKAPRHLLLDVLCHISTFLMPEPFPMKIALSAEKYIKYRMNLFSPNMENPLKRKRADSEEENTKETMAETSTPGASFFGKRHFIEPTPQGAIKDSTEELSVIRNKLK